jgi:rhodanese-related sulfurtransferase
VDPKTVHERRDELQLLDVREDEEWAAGRIDGATHIPLAELPDRLTQLDRNRPLVTICRSGGRAARAADYLSQTGLPAEVLDGGMTHWAETGFPVTTPDGRPGYVA